jgi:hypothetical protein
MSSGQPSTRRARGALGRDRTRLLQILRPARTANRDERGRGPPAGIGAGDPGLTSSASKTRALAAPRAELRQQALEVARDRQGV